MLRIEDLRKNLNPNLDDRRKLRFELAFRSLKYQDEYCRYHYEEFKKYHGQFLTVWNKKFSDEDVQNPEYYRIAFESNCIAFFRSFHSQIESIPYLLNLLLEVVHDSESRYINWKTIIESNAADKYKQGINQINQLRSLDSYRELSEIANVSKHRRVLLIDSGFRSKVKSACFCVDDFDSKLRSYKIDYLMETIYDDLRPKALSLINSFLD